MTNNNLMLVNKEVRMTSIEVCEMINGFRKMEENKSVMIHADLMKKIRKEVETLESVGIAPEGNFSLGNYKDTNNQERPCYSLNRDAIVQITMSESALVRYKVIEYINKLEEELNSMRLPKTYKEALIALVENIEENEKLEKENQLLLIDNTQMKPKAELCEERIDKRGSLTFTDVTKTLGLKRGQISVWLKQNGYIHKTKQEVNEKGKGYFVVYGVQHQAIGIIEKGLQLINDNIDEIRKSPTKMPKVENKK